MLTKNFRSLFWDHREQPMGHMLRHRYQAPTNNQARNLEVVSLAHLCQGMHGTNYVCRWKHDNILFSIVESIFLIQIYLIISSSPAGSAFFHKEEIQV
jgi:hypothetical protein